MMDKPAILGGEPVSKKPIRFTEILLTQEEKEAVMECLDARHLTSGEYIEKFEKAFAQFIGVRHALAISNGTDALFLSYLALNLTFKKKIITTPLTFIATASSIIHAGAIPIFADVENDGNISPESVRSIMKKEEISAITVVHMYGKPVKLEEFKEICNEAGIPLIEDAAHAHGAEYKGRKIGTWGDIAAFSLYPTKIIAAGGWGGVLTTNNDELYEELILLRAHGELRHIIGPEGAYVYRRLGYNMRMSNIEAAVAYYQLLKINDFIEKRRRNAKLLSEKLIDLPGIEVPREEPNSKHVYYIYAITIDEKKIKWTRDEFVKALNKEGIEAKKGYHIPLHQQEFFRKINDPKVNHFALVNSYPDYSRMHLPNAERLSKTTIWLPMHPNLTEEDIEKIAHAIEKLINWKKRT